MRDRSKVTHIIETMSVTNDGPRNFSRGQPPRLLCPMEACRPAKAVRLPAHPMNQSTTLFDTFSLSSPLLRALAEKEYTHASPIQEQAIPHLLEGRDLVGCAQTGTGKTAAFALPILHRLSASPTRPHPRSPRALILSPTRELAGQIAESFAAYGKHVNLTHAVIYGGVGQDRQVRALARGIDILVATPGRLLDLIGQGHVRLDRVEIFVLDEADRMLDMGFAPDMKRIAALLPARRQSLLFSATMPDPIRALAQTLLDNPVNVNVAPASTTADRIEQRVCHVARADKLRLLLHLAGQTGDGLVLVFTRTKHGANKLADNLGRSGIRAEAIHGNKSQSARQRALDNFREGRSRVLVATDVAARGIDVKGIALVVNFDIPNEPESYIHRIGRTARAGAEGIAVSFCDQSERAFLRDIQRLIKTNIPVDHTNPFPLAASVADEPSPAQGKRGAPAQRPGNGSRFGRNRYNGRRR